MDKLVSILLFLYCCFSYRKSYSDSGFVKMAVIGQKSQFQTYGISFIIFIHLHTENLSS